MNPFFKALQWITLQNKPPEATESSRPWRLPPHALSLEDSRRRQGLCTPDDSYHNDYHNSALISKLSWWPLTLITPPPFSALSVANPARHCERFIYKDWQYKGHICNISEQNFPHLLQIIKLIHTSSCVDVLVKLLWVPAHMCVILIMIVTKILLIIQASPWTGRSSIDVDNRLLPHVEPDELLGRVCCAGRHLSNHHRTLSPSM